MEGWCNIYVVSIKRAPLCENHRVIIILNSAYKVLSQILLRRVLLIAKRFIYQAEFVEGWRLWRFNGPEFKCCEFRILFHHIFIDFKAANDTVKRPPVSPGRFQNKLEQ